MPGAETATVGSWEDILGFDTLVFSGGSPFCIFHGDVENEFDMFRVLEEGGCVAGMRDLEVGKL